MNYLAHIYLSGNNPEVMVGNFIGDHVKGKRFNRYPDKISTGILLHRHIDAFTDNHPVFKQSASLFREGYKRYAGVVADVVYDHFLALNWPYYSNIPLNKFVSEAHGTLIRHYFTLPLRVKQFLPFLIKSRRLETYQDLSGVERTLNIMSSNSSLPGMTDFALYIIQEYSKEIQGHFNIFMPEIIASTKAFLADSDALYRPKHSVIS